MARRTLFTLLIIVGVPLGILMVLNLAGWRARLLARLFRATNRAVIVTPPQPFNPRCLTGSGFPFLPGDSTSHAGWQSHPTATFSSQTQPPEKSLYCTRQRNSPLPCRAKPLPII